MTTAKLAMEAIAQLAELPDNWDTYGSPAICAAALKSAGLVVSAMECENLPTPQVSPVAGGGVEATAGGDLPGARGVLAQADFVEVDVVVVGVVVVSVVVVGEVIVDVVVLGVVVVDVVVVGKVVVGVVVVEVEVEIEVVVVAKK